MSAEPLTSVGGGEQAIAQRIQQLETLFSQARSASGLAPAQSAAPATAAPAGFAGALQAASAGTGSAREASATATSAPEAGGGEYESMIQQAAARYGVDPAVLHGLIEQESGFDAHAQSSAGAMGLTQLMPGTASTLGVSNPFDPAEAIEGGARYLAQLTSQFGGNTTDALAAYNAGPGAVSQYGGVPPYAETQSYVSKVLSYAEAYRQSHPTTTLASAVAA